MWTKCWTTFRLRPQQVKINKYIISEVTFNNHDKIIKQHNQQVYLNVFLEGKSLIIPAEETPITLCPVPGFCQGGSGFCLSQTNPGPQVQTPPLIRCTPQQCDATGWWRHHFLSALVSWPPLALAAPEPSSAGSLQIGRNQNPNRLDYRIPRKSG